MPQIKKFSCPSVEDSLEKMKRLIGISNFPDKNDQLLDLRVKRWDQCRKSRSSTVHLLRTLSSTRFKNKSLNLGQKS
jgi:hypothetical protein